MNQTRECTAPPPYSVRIDASALRHAMRIRGLTGADLAEKAGRSQATISHALNGRRIHPATLRAINHVLASVRPMEDVANLVARDGDATLLGHVELARPA